MACLQTRCSADLACGCAWRADGTTAVQAVLKLTEDQEEGMVEAYSNMMARLTAIFAKHQSMLVAVADHPAMPEYSNGVGTTTVPTP